MNEEHLRKHDRNKTQKRERQPAWDKASPTVPASPPGHEGCERVAVCVSRCFLPLQSSPVGWDKQLIGQMNTQTLSISTVRSNGSLKKLGNSIMKNQNPSQCPLVAVGSWCEGGSESPGPVLTSGAPGRPKRMAQVRPSHTYTATPRLHGGGRPRRGALSHSSSHSDWNELQHRREGPEPGTGALQSGRVGVVVGVQAGGEVTASLRKCRQVPPTLGMPRPPHRMGRLQTFLKHHSKCQSDKFFALKMVVRIKR